MRVVQRQETGHVRGRHGTEGGFDMYMCISEKPSVGYQRPFTDDRVTLFEFTSSEHAFPADF